MIYDIAVVGGGPAASTFAADTWFIVREPRYSL